MMILAAVWLSGLWFGRHLPGFFVLGLCSYFLWILLFLIFLRKYPAVLFPYVRKKRYGALTLFLLCIPILFSGGFFRQKLYEESVQNAVREWKTLEESNVKTCFVTEW